MRDLITGGYGSIVSACHADSEYSNKFILETFSFVFYTCLYKTIVLSSNALKSIKNVVSFRFRCKVCFVKRFETLKNLVQSVCFSSLLQKISTVIIAIKLSCLTPCFCCVVSYCKQHSSWIFFYLSEKR